MYKKIISIVLLFFCSVGFTACDRGTEDPEEVEMKQKAKYQEQDSVKTDPTEGKGEGDLGEGMPPGRY